MKIESAKCSAPVSWWQIWLQRNYKDFLEMVGPPGLEPGTNGL